MREKCKCGDGITDEAVGSHHVTSRISSPIPIQIKNDNRPRSSPMEVSTSYGSVSSPCKQSSPLMTPQSRPTKAEASALLEIISTPPTIGTPTYAKNSSSIMMPSPSYNGAASPILPIPKRPPCESTLPYQSSPPSFQPPSTATKYTLLPRSIKHTDTATNTSCHDDSCEQLHHGLGPLLGILPESILYSIISYIDYTERHPTLHLLSQGMTNLLSRPELLLEMKHSLLHKQSHDKKNLMSQALEEETEPNALNEFLFVVGGKYPIKTGNNQTGTLEDTTNQSTGDQVHLRMAMQSNEQRGILGYDPKRSKWVRFGGNPLEPFGPSQNNLHPLSPLGITDAKPLYIAHPHYCLMFFGGTHHSSNMPSNRVVSYSFLSAKWETWPDMLRSRHGEDFVVARVEGQETDSVVLIGCDLEFCDCCRCNPPSEGHSNEANTNMIGFDNFEHEFNVINTAYRTAQNSQSETIGRCEVLDLKTRTWERRKSKAPTCPPDDGGVAVLEGRYVYLPGTCPPPPFNTLLQIQDDEAEMVTPLSGSEPNSRMQSPSSFIEENNDSSEQSMSESSNDEINTSSLGNLFRSLHYRPGLVYDALLDEWSTLPARPYVTTSSPATVAYKNSVLVLGGYRSSSENALSCYHHREEDAILDYEDHLQYAWWYTPQSTSTQKSGESESKTLATQDNGEWIFGGGCGGVSHTQGWANSSEVATAVAAARVLQHKSSNSRQGDGVATGNNASPLDEVTCDLPNGAPAPLRGATLTLYQGRLIMVGGLSTFSRTFYDNERKAIHQYDTKNRVWRKVTQKNGRPIELPVPSLLDGYSFSVYV